MTPDDPCMTFDHGNDLRVPQRSSWPNLAAVGHSWTNWPPDDLWPVRLRQKVDSSPHFTKPYPHAKFQLCRSKHSRTHSETDRQLSAKFGGHRAFLKNLTSGWPWLTLAWPLIQQWVTLWSRVLPTKFCGHMAFLSNLTSGWPWLTPAWPLTPAMHYALVRHSSHQIWWP